MQALKQAVNPASGALGRLMTFARRDLRGGIRGFGIFIACIAIGVAAVTAVAAVSRGLTDSLAREGRVILGADAAFVTLQREAAPDELAWLQGQGRVAPVAYMRAMARADGGESMLVEGKAVDDSYPAHGKAATIPDRPMAELLARRDGLFGAVADPLLFARLGAKPGDSIVLGEMRVQLRAELTGEPDKLAGGIGFGPRLLISVEALRASGLVQPGSLMRWSYRVTLPGEPSEAAVQSLVAEANARFPQAGWEVRSRMNASPQFSRQIDRFTQFLTLIGLTALVVGGVGVANATEGFVDLRRADLATLKSLGATGGFVFSLMLAEIMALALAGSLIGLAAGAAIPVVLVQLFGHLLPLPLSISLPWSEAAIAIAYGLLTTLAFASWPLGRAHDVPVSGLFRDSLDPSGVRPRLRYMLLTAAAVAALAAMAILFAWDRRIAIVYAASAAAAFLALRIVGLLVMALARRLPRPRRAEARLALANLHRPGALTPSVTLSLGLGLTLLVALGLIDANLRNALTGSIPARAPSLFFLDIPNDETARFDALLREKGGQGDPDAVTIDRAPMMRGRIVAIKGEPAETYKAAENAAWVLEGDRGITYSAELPANSRLAQGRWWPAGYSGKPLVSMTREIVEGLGLSIGDDVTVNVMGRNVTAELASIRQVEWRSVGINFVMVFSPNAFAGAPHTHLATLSYAVPPSGPAEAQLAREVAAAFPAVSSVRVRDVLEQAGVLIGQLTLAMRGASAVALVSSILVLGGALAAGRAARVKDAVVMKTLGATRRQLLGAYLMEYAALGVVTAAFGLLAGVAAAYGTITAVMRLPFAMDWGVAATSITLALSLTVILGLLGTWRILGQKPAAYLRQL